MTSANTSGEAQPGHRVVDVFLRYLKAEGASVVFGIPGGLLQYFFEAIEDDDDLRLVITKHESGAAFMADGYARAGNRLAVCAGTSGPGSTNLITGVACAYADGVPLLVVTGQAATHSMGRGAAQETAPEDIDIVGMFRPVTKYSVMVTSPESLAHHLRRALRQALTGKPGPVHLNIPVDLWLKPLEEAWFDPHSYRPESQIFDRKAVGEAAGLLLGARHPVVLAGGGVRAARAEEHLRALAEMLPARVATTPRGKGVFPEDHPLSLGILGFAGHELASNTLFGDEVDVLLTVGTSLNETVTLNWNPDLRPTSALLQIDIDPHMIGRNYPVDVALVGHAQTILVELVYHVHRLIRSENRACSEWVETPPSALDHRHYEAPERRASDQIPLTPERWRCDLEEVLPKDAILFSDIGGHMFFNLHNLCIRDGQRFIINFGFASMGHGTAAPVGAALAQPDHPVVAIVGDACFTMCGMELLTAVEYGVPVVWIVENNNMHGIIWHGSKLVGRRRPLEAIRYNRPLEVAAIGRAMGLHTWLVDRPAMMQAALTDALSLRRPALIEVRVDGEIPPPLGERAKSIAGFGKGN